MCELNVQTVGKNTQYTINFILQLSENGLRRLNAN